MFSALSRRLRSHSLFRPHAGADALTSGMRPALSGFLVLSALAIASVPAQAGSWKLRMDVSGSTSYTNNVSKAVEAGHLYGTNINPGASIDVWKSPTSNGNSIGFGAGDGFVIGPTDAARNYGGIAEPATGGVPPTILASKIEASGSVSVVLEWVPDPNRDDDLPPTRVKVVENADAGAEVVHMISAGFEVYTQEVDCGLPDPNLTGEEGEYPWKNANRSLATTLENPNRSTTVHLPTRHLKALSDGSAGGLSVRIHDVAVHYNVTVQDPGGAVSGDARPVVLKEYPDGRIAPIWDFDGRVPITGDRAWVGMEFMVGPYARLSEKHKSVTMRLKEEEDEKLGSDQHPEAENHFDANLPLSSGQSEPEKPMKWQKRIGAYGEWEDTAERFSTPNLSQDWVYYRVLWPWDTHKTNVGPGSTLWDHNGLHTVSVYKVDGKIEDKKIAFEPAPDEIGSGTTVSKFDDFKIDIQNLFITNVEGNVGNSDYFIFDSKSSAPSNQKEPKILFTIADASADSDVVYQCRIRVRSTDDDNPSNSVVYEKFVNGPQSVVVNINQDQTAPDSPKLFIDRRGSYNFEISISKHAGSYKNDSSSYRSTNLYIPSLVSIDGKMVDGHTGKLVRREDNSVDWQASYILKDKMTSAIKAKELRFDVLGPHLDQIQVDTNPQMGKNLNQYYNEVLIRHFNDGEFDGKGYISIVSGVDNHAVMYRDHNPRHMLCKNTRATGRYDFHMWIDSSPSSTYSALVSNSAWSYAISYASSVYNAASVNVPVYWHTTIAPAVVGTTATFINAPAGVEDSVDNGGTFKSNSLTPAQQNHGAGLGGKAINWNKTLIITEVPNLTSKDSGDTYASFRSINPEAPPARPGIIAFVTSGISKALPDISATEYPTRGLRGYNNKQVMVSSNCLVHEMYHAGAETGPNHCVRDLERCVTHNGIDKWFITDMRFLNTYYQGTNALGDFSPVRSPFHSTREVNTLRTEMHRNPF